MSGPSAESASEGPVLPAGGDGFLTFSVDGREFGVPIAPVVEIVGYRDATPVPHAAEAVEGILAVRGWIVTVIDARRGLGLPPRPQGSAARVIVIESEGGRLGLVVDRVLRVTHGDEGVAVFDIGSLLRDLS